ncbi:glycoside hydrolase family 75 protein [Trichoderma velutinum]
MHSSTLFTLLATGTTSLAYTIPSNLQAIYNAHKSGTCGKPLSGTSSSGAVWCGDIPNAIFLKGSNGNYDNMDVDCDGADDKAGDCSNDPTGFGETAFMDTVQSFGISDLNANIHPYVVVNEPPYFDAQHFGLQPLSVMAVVCNNQVWYGIWGDTNTEPTTGEASISLAQLCYPNDGLNGDRGHGTKDVLYIGFLGDGTTPGKSGAKWNAKNVSDFEASIKSLGDKLVQGLGSSTGGGGTTPPPSCSWDGHCAGASCGSDDDCADDLTCNSGICGSGSSGGGSTPPPTTCSWEGHCLGASCGSDDDCSDDFVCSGGKCSNP